LEQCHVVSACPPDRRTRFRPFASLLRLFGNPGHNHTPQQFQLIAHLSLLIATAATFVALVFGQAGAAFVFGVRKPVARRGMPVRVYGLRAPPLD